MKTKKLLLTLFIVMAAITSFAQFSAKPKKMLIVYFSHSGNTQTIADFIREATGADVFCIEPVTAYPKEHQAVVDQADREIEAGVKPPIKGKVPNFESYDVIFVGSPSWWSTIAPPVSTFLSSYDFTGKTIVPFITHEGSRMGRAAEDIKKLSPKATLLNGLPVRGGSVKNAKGEVTKWLQDIKLIK